MYKFLTLQATDTATSTTELAAPIQEVVDTVSSEVEQTTSVLSKIFHPLLEKLPSLIFALAIFGLGMLLVKQIMRIIRRTFEHSNMDRIMASFLRSVIKIVLYMLLAVITLSILDVPMDSIVAVIASAGVGVALALKDSLSNLAGGFIILFSKPLKEGDVVEINGSTGKIESISILYTRMVTPDNTTVYIPNGVVASGKIVNFTDKELRRVDLFFGISYHDDIDKARAILIDEVHKAPEALEDPPVEVFVSGHEANAITLRLHVWTKSENYWPLYYRLMENVKKAFDNKGVSIPYPQVDIHIPPNEETDS